MVYGQSKFSYVSSLQMQGHGGSSRRVLSLGGDAHGNGKPCASQWVPRTAGVMASGPALTLGKQISCSDSTFVTLFTFKALYKHSDHMLRGGQPGG